MVFKASVTLTAFFPIPSRSAIDSEVSTRNARLPDRLDSPGTAACLVNIKSSFVPKDWCAQHWCVSNKGGSIMKLFTITIAGCMLAGMTGVALANPSMLPKHPGYPSGGDFANDTGQQNLSYSQSLMEAAKSGDTSMTPTLMDQKDVDKLPVVQEPNVKTGPSMKEGERRKK
jgi:hypothetical protein